MSSVFQTTFNNNFDNAMAIYSDEMSQTLKNFARVTIESLLFFCNGNIKSIPRQMVEYYMMSETRKIFPTDERTGSIAYNDFMRTLCKTVQEFDNLNCLEAPPGLEQQNLSSPPGLERQQISTEPEEVKVENPSPSSMDDMSLSIFTRLRNSPVGKTEKSEIVEKTPKTNGEDMLAEALNIQTHQILSLKDIEDTLMGKPDSMWSSLKEKIKSSEAVSENKVENKGNTSPNTEQLKTSRSEDEKTTHSHVSDDELYNYERPLTKYLPPADDIDDLFYDGYKIVFFTAKGFTESEIKKYFYENYPSTEYRCSYNILGHLPDNDELLVSRVSIRFTDFQGSDSLKTLIDSKLETNEYFKLNTTFVRDKFLENIEPFAGKGNTKYIVSKGTSVNDRVTSYTFSLRNDKAYELPSKKRLVEIFKGMDSTNPSVKLKNIPLQVFRTLRPNTLYGFKYIVKEGESIDENYKTIVVFKDSTRKK